MGEMDELERMGLRPVELKPCPFCAGRARISWIRGEYSTDMKWKVKCHTCGGGVGFYNDPYEAAAHWNRRNGSPISIRC